jgi:GxxExxY protein
MNDELNHLTEAIIGAAIEIHREFGPGLLESAYRACLVHELIQRGHLVEYEKKLPIRYKNLLVESGFRLDLLIDGKVIIEVKTVDRLHPVHEAQLITYLKLTGCKVGLLINFNVKVLKDGIRRRVLDL